MWSLTPSEDRANQFTPKLSQMTSWPRRLIDWLDRYGFIYSIQ